MARNFKTIYWGDDRSTEVVFEATNELPPRQLVSAAFVFALHDADKVAMAKPKRGWGLPGGHREGNESAEECVIREALEEASITLGNLRLVGRWAAKKRFPSPFNEKYPDEAYQLLYVADVKELLPFDSGFETSERAFVPMTEIAGHHQGYEDLKDVFDYVIEEHCP